MQDIIAAAGAVFTALLSTLPAAAQQIQTVQRSVDRGGTVRIIGFYDLDPNCRTLGPVAINLVSPPQGGVLTLKDGRRFPKYDPSNIRFRCNKIKVPLRDIFYTASPDFMGNDSFVVETVGSNGEAVQSTWTVHVD